MPSFNIVNYSLRPNKSIQRSLVFEGIKQLQTSLDLERMIYVGFGSIWFADFILAHKLLGIEDMFSMEGNEIGAKRAVFNKPFKTVEVKEGLSADVLPDLLNKATLQVRPWFTWLDYDQTLNEASVDDIRLIIEQAPPNSVILVTLSASGGPLGKPKDRPARIKKLLGKVVPDELSQADCQEDKLPQTLAGLIENFMVTAAVDAGRPGGLLPAFRMTYKDGTSMLTVGAILPAKGAAPAAKATIQGPNWPGFPSLAITAPHLTLRESAVLQAELPCKLPLTRADIQKLGFDLEDNQLLAFETFYRYYPSFAQINT